LLSVNGNLDSLGKLNIDNLTQFKGIGQAKAISIIAALEIGRRRLSTTTIEKPRIQSSKMF
jgi:DNA repair protein RadC